MKTIKLTRGLVALVDDEDYDYLNQWKWYAKASRNTFYACRSIWYPEKKKKKNIKMNRLVLGVSDSNILVDHIDRNGLNNQRNNLRVSTYSQNGANASRKGKGSSQYLGVSWQKDVQKWSVRIKKNYKDKYIGIFESEIDAALAYNKAAKELHGDFANLNKITA